ncbi:MAG: hypothetical protein ACYC3X_11640 [Pirellulaceae bacterium]
MNEQQRLLDERLLDEARSFCDPATGEVIELIPEELMKRLRVAKLAVGISGAVSQTTTSAKWIVFLNDQIRAQALTQWRETSRKRQHTKPRPAKSSEPTPAGEVQSPATPKVARGLRGFLPPKKPDS